MEWADGIGAARKRPGLAPQCLQRSVCNDSKSLVNQSKQAIWKRNGQAVLANQCAMARERLKSSSHCSIASCEKPSFLKTVPNNRIVELKMRYLPWPPEPSEALRALGQ